MLKRIIGLIIFIVAIILFINSTVKNNNWDKFRGPNGNGIIEDNNWNPEKLSKEPEIIWNAKIGTGYSEPIIINNLLYIVGYKEKLDNIYCIDINTGNIFWKYSYQVKLLDYNGPRATPCVDDKNLYSLSQDGRLTCLSRLDGKLIWEKNIINDYNALLPTWGFTGSPIITGDTLLINANRYGIALNKNDGKVIWSSPSDTCGYATPVLFNYQNNDYIAMFGKNAINIVNLINGELLTNYSWPTSYDVNSSDPVIINDMIFISTGYGTGCALLKLENNNLNLLWKNRNIASHFPGTIYYNNCLFGISGDSGNNTSFSKLDLVNGKIKWSRPIDFGSFILAGDKFMYLTERGRIIIIDAKTDKYIEIVKTRLKNGLYWAAPVYNNGKLFCRNSSSGELYCINVK